MTQEVKKLVDEFDALTETERQEALVELLRRACTGRHDLPTDEDLTVAADRLFQELDRREQPQ